MEIYVYPCTIGLCYQMHTAFSRLKVCKFTTRIRLLRSALFHQVSNLQRESIFTSHSSYYLCLEFSFESLSIIECYCFCILILSDLCLINFYSKVLFVIFLFILHSCLCRNFLYNVLPVLCCVFEVLFLYLDADILLSTVSHRCYVYLWITEIK